ncbi:putative phosphotransacetylase [Natranaerovirga hydrolytica]|uniref:Phosphate propanoyltransferase n=1 Tax=Natranaerovirga hydrolytica TaxID=680378 RepID=A0A4V2PZ12_9FIRM|nr:phosphate propanoyltransferase [Natranaerovirga hydrolytica]TCK88031.1 putative phosphotransacetylase [Natranaerovirga hydrolytica]
MSQEAIIRQVTRMVIEKINVLNQYKIPIGVSNRHIHLKKSDMEKLFGEGYTLQKLKDLKQPGQYAALETVSIRGPKGTIENVRILGPLRKNTQVEISLTDSFKLGVKAPIRESGQLDNTPGLTIIGPKGSVKIPNGAIVALRHIHMTPQKAEELGVKDKDIVEVETWGQRKCIIGNVLVRVSKDFALEMHIDLDEANASALRNNDHVILKKNRASG